MAAYLLWQPLHNGWLRYGLPLALAVVWAGLLMLAWERKPWRMAFLCLSLLAGLPLVMPGRELDRDRLTDRYLSSMRSFEGTRYVWGGEGQRGIDCSGLPRRGLRDALLDQAVRGNGRAARMWLEQWWYDTSAKAMGEGYRGFTRPAGIEGPLWKLDPALIHPGDLAVTGGGNHVMIHLGGGDWIQSDPGPGKVIIARPDQVDNPWFRSKVSIHRWSVFE
ncbi:C40 family peptidase [Luteolibacter arcticus]|uniref:C40 family peptidase n=1 Tax=Luteolibacter arcticus TaxID=1581411 RepID=A0ABT3GMR1_9BACT|nr:C40 family peptidase [Luteolibacter arcticus]MCW1924799.1 C40 family peptidase [Luteolibacter arcticus]